MLWDSYDRATSASKARAKLKAARELELASKDDAYSKADAWILTKQVMLEKSGCFVELLLLLSPQILLLHANSLEAVRKPNEFPSSSPQSSPVYSTKSGSISPRPTLIALRAS